MNATPVPDFRRRNAELVTENVRLQLELLGARLVIAARRERDAQEATA